MIVGVVVENFQQCRAKLDEEEQNSAKNATAQKRKKKAPGQPSMILKKLRRDWERPFPYRLSNWRPALELE
jgi:hypothetical protein